MLLRWARVSGRLGWAVHATSQCPVSRAGGHCPAAAAAAAAVYFSFQRETTFGQDCADGDVRMGMQRPQRCIRYAAAGAGAGCRSVGTVRPVRRVQCGRVGALVGGPNLLKGGKGSTSSACLRWMVHEPGHTCLLRAQMDGQSQTGGRRDMDSGEGAARRRMQRNGFLDEA